MIFKTMCLSAAMLLFIFNINVSAANSDDDQEVINSIDVTVSLPAPLPKFTIIGSGPKEEDVTVTYNEHSLKAKILKVQKKWVVTFSDQIGSTEYHYHVYLCPGSKQKARLKVTSIDGFEIDETGRWERN